MPGKHKEPTIAFRPSAWARAIIEQRAALSGIYKKDFTQTSHIKNGIFSLKNQYFSSQNSAQAAAEPHSNAFCMYFGSL